MRCLPSPIFCIFVKKDSKMVILILKGMYVLVQLIIKGSEIPVQLTDFFVTLRNSLIWCGLL